MKHDKDTPNNNNTAELSLFEEALADYIKSWQESGEDPIKSLEKLKGDASELLSDALDPIPCWNRVKTGLLRSFANGLYETPTGMALVYDNYFVMLEDLAERLPRIE